VSPTSERIIVELTEMQQETGQQKILVKIREPGGHHGMWQFDCSGHDEVFNALRLAAPDTDVVSAAGRALFDAFTQPDPMRRVLTVALAAQEPDRRPIYLDLSDADDSQDLPWETLCAPNDRFLALEPCWPVARMLNGTRKPVVERTLQPPLRLTAILSCLGVQADEEWDALCKAVKASAAPISVQLFLSEDELFDRVDALKLPWLRTEKVPQELSALQDLITAFEPHLMHFFCHGLATGGAHLEIATATDWLGDSGSSHHRLEARSIRDLVRTPKQSPWAIVLNACSTAAAAAAGQASGTQSLAATLVGEQGVPAVVGMREPVLGSDAARFTNAFYTALLTDLRDQIEVGAQGVELDWAVYTVGARAELCQDRDVNFSVAAARYKAWTLPVVAVARSPFRLDIAGDIRVAPDVFEAARRLFQGAAAMLAGLPPDAPSETRAAFEALLQQQKLRAGGR
jgi:hypothetical protein